MMKTGCKALLFEIAELLIVCMYLVSTISHVGGDICGLYRIYHLFTLSISSSSFCETTFKFQPSYRKQKDLI